MLTLPIDDDKAWEGVRGEWELRSGTIYLNHGSFGPPPRRVRRVRQQWQERLDSQPMDFLVRQFEPAWFEARRQLAAFVGADADDLVFVENATAAMNIVAGSFPLSAGDEVVLTNHEYGAVERIWQRACRERGAAEPVIVPLPLPLESSAKIVEALFAATTARTRLLVVSHITSPTAVVLPVAEICEEARRREIAVCVDGPHAVAQLPLEIAHLGCDFYTASCHKWLSAPFGSGFLFVSRQRQPWIRTPLLSWGRVASARRERWFDEFVWSGTRDPSAFLSVPAAIQFLRDVGFELFRMRTHFLARYARQRLAELLQTEPLVPDSSQWFASMALLPLPPVDRQLLQNALWQQHGIEVPIVEWNHRQFIRVSCHLYNRRDEIDTLVDALAARLR